MNKNIIPKSCNPFRWNDKNHISHFLPNLIFIIVFFVLTPIAFFVYILLYRYMVIKIYENELINKILKSKSSS